MGCTPSAEKVKKIPSSNVIITKKSKQYTQKYYEGLPTTKKLLSKNTLQTNKNNSKKCLQIQNNQTSDHNSPNFKLSKVQTNNNYLKQVKIQNKKVKLNHFPLSFNPAKNQKNNLVTMKSVSQLQIHSNINLQKSQDTMNTIQGVQMKTQSKNSNKQAQQQKAQLLSQKNKFQSYKKNKNMNLLKMHLDGMNEQNFQRIKTARMHF